MSTLELIIMAIGLSMDAFAVSICKGLSMKKYSIKNSFINALYLSIFHFTFPIIGYFLGTSFSSLLERTDHWIAFVLLSIVGSKMIIESFEKTSSIDDKVDFKSMILISLATSIDAFAIGVSLAFLEVNIWISSIIILIVVFAFSMIGSVIGNKFGNKFGNKAEFIGGLVLIVIGIKILLEHLGVI